MILSNINDKQNCNNSGGISTNKSNINIRVTGTGSYIPKDIYTNDDIAKFVDTSDDWIFTRTGISERRIEVNGLNATLVHESAKNALENARLSAEELDLIIVATVTPDRIVPSQACTLQWQIGASCPAFDINAACSGFIYGLNIASSYLLSGRHKNILIVASEMLSRITNWKDRTTCVLFGDAAGAAVLSVVDNPSIFSSFILAEGDRNLVLSCPGIQGDFPDRINKDIIPSYLSMNGHEVFKFAVRSFTEGVNAILAANNLKVDDIKWYIPHQANIRIIEASSQRLNIPMERFKVVLDKYGNTSSAGIPLALDELNREGKLNRGDKIVITAFGGGLTSACALFEW